MIATTNNPGRIGARGLPTESEERRTQRKVTILRPQGEMHGTGPARELGPWSVFACLLACLRPHRLGIHRTQDTITRSSILTRWITPRAPAPHKQGARARRASSQARHPHKQGAPTHAERAHARRAPSQEDIRRAENTSAGRTTLTMGDASRMRRYRRSSSRSMPSCSSASRITR